MHSPLIGIWVILLIYLFLLLALTFHNLGLKCMGPLIPRFFSINIFKFFETGDDLKKCIAKKKKSKKIRKT